MVSKKRNNFFHVGEALRSIFTGAKIHYSNPSLERYKEFMDQEGKKYRSKIIDMIGSHKGKDDILNFN